MDSKVILTRELHEIEIIARPRFDQMMHCPSCDSCVRWLEPEEAMLLMKRSLRHVFRLIEKGEIHFAETEQGFLLVCAESLAGAIKKIKRS